MTRVSAQTKNQSSPNTLVTPVMDQGDTLGFPVENNTGPIILADLETENLTAGGNVFPFATPTNVPPQIILMNSISI